MLASPANVVNVEQAAGERGIELNAVKETQPPSGLVGNIVGVRATSGNESHRILGTAYADGLPRVLRIDDYPMDLVATGEMVLIENDDQPGVIGLVGNTFGNAKINIADMVISRTDVEGQKRALMVLKVDTPPGRRPDRQAP